MHKLPKSIKIGAHRWKFKKLNDKQATEDVKKLAAEHTGLGLHGLCEHATNTIYINPLLLDKPIVLAETVWHEVGHAINDTYGIDDNQSEEHINTQSSKGWMQVLRDNKPFLAYITELLNAKEK